ncbi:MAG: hypothetical protein M0R33_13915 [Methylomonas sp.]|jgi:hypothetical protein|uniref:hypothetical protein n=1 Tax=Methylomonas sp. TaxID=418 RepID=UPI0025D33E41|nr:hypothetical protein [Methylomonas sp.]MCK9607532.1 hypothetical protein [Methylomonas sp.]
MSESKYGISKPLHWDSGGEVSQDIVDLSRIAGFIDDDDIKPSEIADSVKLLESEKFIGENGDGDVIGAYMIIGADRLQQFNKREVGYQDSATTVEANLRYLFGRDHMLTNAAALQIPPEELLAASISAKKKAQKTRKTRKKVPGKAAQKKGGDDSPPDSLESALLTPPIDEDFAIVGGEISDGSSDSESPSTESDDDAFADASSDSECASANDTEEEIPPQTHDVAKYAIEEVAGDFAIAD